MEGGVVLVFNMCIVIYSRRGLLTFGDSIFSRAKFFF